jgi:7-carboxy-7-deazaguanine synthase
MPEGVAAETLDERAAWITEICKQFGFRFSPRLHVQLYGNRRGV